ncbi:head decoration protein [uncultured Sulfitobacter sp.]|uniref:head decoration protein n=1 Tax=uncultured Sulfitobacter sp. TaxID=191468 RepID=UPI00262B77BC|nr:head decoration protein [uncultured Sulfitobacter sp.]
MPTLTEGKTPGDFMLFEEHSFYSRDEVVVAAGADLEPGTVLGKITASGKFVACDHTAADGSEVAAAVLYTPALAADADVTDAVVIARQAQVRRGGLTFDAAFTTETHRDGAVAELKAAGIIAV